MKHVSEELARFSGGRICPRNDDQQSGRISATPSASSINDQQSVSPEPLRAQPLSTAEEIIDEENQQANSDYRDV
jgi:hypothetical protein